MKWVNLGIVVVALASATVGTAAEPSRKAKYTKKNDPNEAARKDVLLIKRVFMFAVDDCASNSRCDQQLMRDSESNFMDACKVCADTEKCEADRDTIKGGGGKLNFNPCAETTAASTTKK